jgi:arsenate reductase-like glutaredoxin family protein
MSARERSEEASRVLHELASTVRPLLKAQGIDVKPLPDDIRKLSVEELVHELATETRKLLGFNIE